MKTIMPLSAGEPAPWFPGAIRNHQGDAVSFDELAGRHIVLFFFGSAARPDINQVIANFGNRNDLLDGKRALFVGISNDPDDFNQGRVRPTHDGQRFLLDSTGIAAKQYGLAKPDSVVMPPAISPLAFILSPALQIMEIIPWTEPSAFFGRVMSLLCERLPNSMVAQNAPVLVVPQVFDRDFCRRLIGLYDAAGGREIGAIENKGKIVAQFDPKFRKRFDYYISDDQTVQQARTLLERRLLPMVFRSFQFQTTRIERYLVGCYDAQTGGYFRPHRDNTAPPVAHRRFAVTINLNEDYEGGQLCFPEFGYQTFRASPGDAIVFSCSLLHEVTPVARERRYAFLSFFYDERSQQMRDEYTKKMSARK